MARALIGAYNAFSITKQVPGSLDADGGVILLEGPWHVAAALLAMPPAAAAAAATRGGGSGAKALLAAGKAAVQFADMVQIAEIADTGVIAAADCPTGDLMRKAVGVVAVLARIEEHAPGTFSRGPHAAAAHSLACRSLQRAGAAARFCIPHGGGDSGKSGGSGVVHPAVRGTEVASTLWLDASARYFTCLLSSVAGAQGAAAAMFAAADALPSAAALAVRAAPGSPEAYGAAWAVSSTLQLLAKALDTSVALGPAAAHSAGEQGATLLQLLACRSPDHRAEASWVIASLGKACNLDHSSSGRTGSAGGSSKGARSGCMQAAAALRAVASKRGALRAAVRALDEDAHCHLGGPMVVDAAFWLMRARKSPGKVGRLLLAATPRVWPMLSNIVRRMADSAAAPAGTLPADAAEHVTAALGLLIAAADAASPAQRAALRQAPGLLAAVADSVEAAAKRPGGGRDGASGEVFDLCGAGGKMYAMVCTLLKMLLLDGPTRDDALGWRLPTTPEPTLTVVADRLAELLASRLRAYGASGGTVPHPRYARAEESLLTVLQAYQANAHGVDGRATAAAGGGRIGSAASSTGAGSAAEGSAAGAAAVPPAGAARVTAACAGCHRQADAPAGVTLKPCTGCWSMRYCSTACQAQHWEACHRRQCRRLAAARGARAAAGGGDVAQGASASRS